MNRYDVKEYMETWREGVATELLAQKRLPRRLQKMIGFLIFLVVSSLTLLGGVFMAATFMHVIVTRLDMPPANPYPVYTIGQTQLMQTTPSAAVKGSIVQAPATQIQSSARTSHANVQTTTVTLLRRPTIGDALDKWIAQTQNPANAYLQEDAVDTGLYLQREVHQWLLSIFARATRITQWPTVNPQGVSLTNGQ